MKNISLVLNFILLFAVGYLYYLHFSLSGGPETAPAGPQEEEVVPSVITPKDVKASKIVYINADTLFEKYKYVTDFQKSAEGRKAQLERNYQTKAQSFQDDLMKYQQLASQGAISVEAAKSTEEDLRNRKSELEGMEDDLSDLMSETQRKNSEVQKEISDYLQEYNKNNHYNFVLAYTSLGGGLLYASDSLDITNEIVDGLNKRYEEKKKNKPQPKK